MKLTSKILLITSCVALSTQAYAHDAGQPHLPQGNYTAPEHVIAANPEFDYALPAQNPAARNIPTERGRLSSYASPQQAAAFLNNRLFMTVEELRGDDTTGVGSHHAHEFRPIQPAHEDYDPRNYDDAYQIAVAAGVGVRNLNSPTESEVYDQGTYSVFESRQKRVRFADPLATYCTANDTDNKEEVTRRTTLSAADQALSDGFKKALTDLIESFYQKQ